MTTKPPSHEEVQRIIEWLGTSWGSIGGKRVNFGEVLESLLADNVRLSGEVDESNASCIRLMDERDQLRARIGEKDERIAALEKDAARGRFVIERSEWLRHGEDRDRAGFIAVRVPYETDLSCVAMRENALDAAIDAALNPQCSGTAAGREG